MNETNGAGDSTCLLISTVTQVMRDVPADGVKVRADEATVRVIRLNNVARASPVAMWKAPMATVLASLMVGDISERGDVFPVRADVYSERTEPDSMGTDLSFAGTDLSSVWTDLSSVQTDLPSVRTDLSSVRTDFGVPCKALNLDGLGWAFRARASVFLADGSEILAQGSVGRADWAAKLENVWAIG